MHVDGIMSTENKNLLVGLFDDANLGEPRAAQTNGTTENKVASGLAKEESLSGVEDHLIALYKRFLRYRLGGSRSQVRMEVCLSPSFRKPFKVVPEPVTMVECPEKNNNLLYSSPAKHEDFLNIASNLSLT